MKYPPQPPGAFFNTEVVLDMFVTGLGIGLLSLCSYLVVIFGFGNSYFGYDCNKSGGQQTCSLVWEARTTAYCVLYMLLLVQGFVCRHARKSMFSQSPINNPVLLGSVIGGGIFLQGTIYIPAVAKNLYKHAPISWEWVIVVVCMIVYSAYTELWKWF
eukprot:UN07426